jgi:hypothetical protein
MCYKWTRFLFECQNKNGEVQTVRRWKCRDEASEAKNCREKVNTGTGQMLSRGQGRIKKAL